MMSREFIASGQRGQRGRESESASEPEWWGAGKGSVRIARQPIVTDGPQRAIRAHRLGPFRTHRK
jgi:hypothetical protein